MTLLIMVDPWGRELKIAQDTLERLQARAAELAAGELEIISAKRLGKRLGYYSLRTDGVEVDRF